MTTVVIWVVLVMVRISKIVVGVGLEIGGE